MQRILLVEDNAMNRDLISRRLKRRGYAVILAADGAEGVETATRERPDLILMDIALPLIDGYEATRLIKASPETRNTPVIGLSAHAMSGHMDRALEAGCDDYDTKPIEWPRLLGKIQTLLER
ncbi:MAG: response regulator, partial [Acidobacteriota bacterium]